MASFQMTWFYQTWFTKVKHRAKENIHPDSKALLCPHIQRAFLVLRLIIDDASDLF